MSITRTSSGTIFRTTFPGEEMPSGFNEVKDRTVTIDDGATLVAAEYHYAAIVSQTEIPSDKVFVIRTKANAISNPVNQCGHIMLHLIDHPQYPQTYFSDIDTSGEGQWNTPRRRAIEFFGYGYGSNYDLIFSWRQNGTSTNLLDGGVAGTDYIWEFDSDGTNFVVRLRNASTMEEIASDSNAWGSAAVPNPTNKLWATIGCIVKDCFWVSANNLHSSFEAYLSHNVTVTGLATGNAVRLYDASDDSVLAEAEESGGTATLDCSLVDWAGLTCYFNIFEDNSYAVLLETSEEYVDASGGDIYNYAPVTSYGIFKYYKNGTWREGYLKYHNGVGWVIPTLKCWDGSEWQEITQTPPT